MAANTNPIFTLTPNVGRLAITASSGANTASDGSGTVGTNIYLLFTGGSNGSFVSRLRLHPYASAASTATNASTFRFYLSTQGSGSTTASNTALFQEIALASVTADITTTALSPIDVPINFVVPSGSYILVSVHLAQAANTGVQILAIGGDY